MKSLFLLLKGGKILTTTGTLVAYSFVLAVPWVLYC